MSKPILANNSQCWSVSNMLALHVTDSDLGTAVSWRCCWYHNWINVGTWLRSATVSLLTISHLFTQKKTSFEKKTPQTKASFHDSWLQVPFNNKKLTKFMHSFDEIILSSFSLKHALHITIVHPEYLRHSQTSLQVKHDASIPTVW